MESEREVLTKGLMEIYGIFAYTLPTMYQQLSYRLTAVMLSG